MGRPLTGNLELLPSGSWRASVPAARGSRRRLTATFPDKASARRWMTVAIADLEAGRTPAAPDVAPDGDASDADRHRSEAVFAHYHKQRYGLITTADPERARAVKADYDNHIAAFLAAAEITDIRDIDFDVAVAFSAYLAGKAVTVHKRSTNTDHEVDPPVHALQVTTAGNVISVFDKMLDSAFKRDLIGRNPAANLLTSRPVNRRLRTRASRPRDVQLGQFLGGECQTRIIGVTELA